MNRETRLRIGQQTVEIVRRGWYELTNGERVDLQTAVAVCLGQTTLYTPEGLDALLRELPRHEHCPRFETVWEVVNDTTLAAAYRLTAKSGCQNAMCLNFASAKNPGGGFLGGSQAQEESLARSSALYESLITQQGYYQANRGCGTPLYTDHMILSPNVPIVRSDDGHLLDKPYTINILTAPAVNAGALRSSRSGEESNIRPTMARRIAKVLAVCIAHGYENLILGAWGCGVFRNDPREIAELFREALQADDRFRDRFQRVVFAVLDSSPNRQIVAPFERVFRQGASL